MSETNRSQGNIISGNNNTFNGDIVAGNKSDNSTHHHYYTLPRVNKELSKKNIHLTLHLYEKQPWIKNKQNEFDYLYFDECTDEIEKYLILSLLDKFQYICDTREKEAFENIINHINNNWGLQCEDTLLVFNRQNNWKNYFDANWQQKLIIGKDESITKSQENQNIENIVLIDDFIGTDKDSSEAYKYLIDKVREISRRINIFIVAICMMEKEKENIDDLEDKNIQHYAYIYMPRGISDDLILSEYKNDMQEFEKRLFNKNFLEENKLGYNESEALFYYDNKLNNNKKNIKNNFPIFWETNNHIQNIKRHTLLKSV